MKLRQWLALSCCIGICANNAGAAAPPPSTVQQAVASIAGDTALISGWMSDQLRYAVPFNSTSGAVVPSQIKIFGFEVGVEGVASSTKLDVPALRNLPTSVVNTGNIDTFSRLPMPSVIGHAKIGLPFGLDFGVRGGGIPNENINNGSTHINVKNNIVGFDLRERVIDETMLKPFGLTVGANFTHASGHLDSTTNYSSQGTYQGFNSSLSAFGSNTGSATASSHSQWDTQSWGLQAIANKHILFLNPYIGASVNRNFGTPGTTISTSGRETLSDNSGNSNFTDFQTLASESSSVNKWDLRALIGLELTPFPFLHIGLGGEYAGAKDVAGSLGLRVQFR